MDSKKVYRYGCAQGKHFDCGDEWRRKDRDRMCHRDEPFCSLSMGCVETCTSHLKKEPRRPGFLLPTARCVADSASGSAAGAVGRGQETPGLETTLRDSFDRSDPGSGIAWHPADSASSVVLWYLANSVVAPELATMATRNISWRAPSTSTNNEPTNNSPSSVSSTLITIARSILDS
jgi:hypothetical protein